MAVTKILAKSMRIDKLIRYVSNPDKTDEQTLVSAVNCEVKTAAKAWKATKEMFGKTDGVQAYHIIQSFDIGEVAPQIAHEIGLKFCDEFLEGYEYILATHVDKHHIHNHAIFNSVCARTGMKYTATLSKYYKGIRRISDRLCKEYGLSIIMESESKGLSYAEYKLRKAGVYTLREMFDLDLEECLGTAYDLGSFYALMEAKGYEIAHTSKYPTFKPKEASHGFRAKHNGKSVTEDEILELIMNGMLLEVEEVAVRPREYVPYKAYGKQHGFRALVVSWMYVLGIIGQRKQTSYKVDYTELKRFERYKRDEEFLQKYGIDTEGQLDQKEAAINSEIERLTKSRIILNSKKKRKRRLYDALAALEYYSDAAKLYAEGETGFEDDYKAYAEAENVLSGIDRDALAHEKAELYDGIAEVNKQLRQLRLELKIISDVREDIPHMEECLQEHEELSKEQEDHNHYYHYYEEEIN